MPAKVVAIGRRNSTYQVLQSLRANRRKRHSTRTFLVEGVLPITRALEHGWTFTALVYRDGGGPSSWARDVMRRANAPTHYALTPSLLADLSGKDDASELLAVIAMRAAGIEQIPTTPDLLVAVVDRPANPGNLGTLLRSCDAFGVHGLIISGHAADVYDPTTISASRGAVFGVPIVHVDSPARVGEWVGHVRATIGDCQIVGADERGGVDVTACDLTRATVLVFGNETRGLSHAYQQLCDSAARIPMVGAATSLNVSVAASIVFFEAQRQRRASPPSSHRLA
jgi:23S rRNA (uridine2479-2'-O)-methyltransferase